MDSFRSVVVEASLHALDMINHSSFAIVKCRHNTLTKDLFVHQLTIGMLPTDERCYHGVTSCLSIPGPDLSFRDQTVVPQLDLDMQLSQSLT